MIVFDSEVQPPEHIGDKRILTPSVVAWINTLEDPDETKINWFPGFDDFIFEASEDTTLVGFNIKSFDIPNFLQTEYPPVMAQDKSFDLLWYLKEKVTGTWHQPVKGLTLDELCSLNLGRSKIKLDAPPSDLWAAGEFDVVEMYVKNDAEITLDLLYFMLENGFVEFPAQFKDGVEIVSQLDCNDAQDWLDTVQTRGLIGW